ncbi:MAG: cadherin domain-containing protein [Cyclobacteriaceae bacterium]
MEYYVDTDPGLGSRIDVPLTAAPNQDFTFNVPTSTLSEGFHVLTILAQDVNLAWSHYESKVFYVNQSSSLVQNDIVKIEYFIDSDPGRGLGVDVPVTAASALDFLENIPTASLSEGFHLVTIRAQDSNDQWGLSESQVFYVNKSSTLTQNDITKIEYFIDSDPGQGLGVDVPITAASTLDFLENVPTTSLSEGFHLMTVRAQDMNNQWGLSESKVFYVNQSSTLVQNDINKIEYYLDTDPGFGAGVDVPITSSTDLDFLENIPTASLTEGFHLMVVRAQDQNGQWSLSERKPFFVDRTRQIVLYEYALDTDPGVGLATSQTISPQDEIDFVFDIPTVAETLGPHNLIVRVKDENEFWSKTETLPFTVCNGGLADFMVGTLSCTGTSVSFTDISTLTQPGDVYSWDFDGDGLEDDNTAGDTGFTYMIPGTYSVSLTVDRLGCASTKTKIVTVLSPEIGLFSGLDNSGLAIANMQATAVNVGSGVRGNDIIQTIAIENTGPCSLTVSNIDSDNPAYSISSTIVSIAAGATETFTATLSSIDIGVFDATITIDSDDVDESLFTFPISGAIVNQLPEFTYNFYLDENSDVGKRVGTIVATDLEMDPVSYSIISGNTDNAFSVGSATGDINVITSEALDFETTPIFSLLVEANDGNGGVSIVTVAINLIDIADENPLGIGGLNEKLKIYPNPVHRTLFVGLAGDSSRELDVKLFSVGGIQVVIKSRIKSLANGFLELDLENLAPGIYLLKIQNQEELVTKSILIK